MYSSMLFHKTYSKYAWVLIAYLHINLYSGHLCIILYVATKWQAIVYELADRQS